MLAFPWLRRLVRPTPGTYRHATPHIDDGSAATIDHVRQDELAHVDRGVQVHEEGAVPLARLILIERDEVGEGGIVDQHIDWPVVTAYLIDDLDALLMFREIGWEGVVASQNVVGVA